MVAIGKVMINSHVNFYRAISELSHNTPIAVKDDKEIFIAAHATAANILIHNMNTRVRIAISSERANFLGIPEHHSIITSLEFVMAIATAPELCLDDMDVQLVQQNAVEKTAIILMQYAQILPCAVCIPTNKVINGLLTFRLDDIRDIPPANMHLVNSTDFMVRDVGVAKFSVFATPYMTEQCFALQFKAKTGFEEEPPIVRIHSKCIFGDIMHSATCDCGIQLKNFLESASSSPVHHVLLYLEQHEGRGIGIVNKIAAYNAQKTSHSTATANQMLGFSPDARKYDAAINVLRLLQINSCFLYTNNPSKMEAIASSDIKLLGRVEGQVRVDKYNERYIQDKRDIFGHYL